MDNRKTKRVLLLMLAVIAALSIAVYYLWTEVKSLEHERDAFKWRNFTCDVLLSEPKTRAIMCVRKFKKLER